jgi:hypothetical protein
MLFIMISKKRKEVLKIHASFRKFPHMYKNIQEFQVFTCPEASIRKNANSPKTLHLNHIILFKETIKSLIF